MSNFHLSILTSLRRGYSGDPDLLDASRSISTIWALSATPTSRPRPGRRDFDPASARLSRLDPAFARLSRLDPASARLSRLDPASAALAPKPGP